MRATLPCAPGSSIGLRTQVTFRPAGHYILLAWSHALLQIACIGYCVWWDISAVFKSGASEIDLFIWEFVCCNYFGVCIKETWTDLHKKIWTV